MKKALQSFLIIAILTACNQNQQEQGKDITVPVTVQEIQPRSIEKYIEITGSVKPVKEVQLKAEMSGRYALQKNPATGRLFALGDIVREGDEIIQLQDPEYENNVKINSLKINLDITKQVYDKQQSLYEKGGVTLTDVKNAEINYINAKYAFEDAQFRLQKMHIKAPFSGVLVDLPYFTPGVKVDANALLAKMMDYSKLVMEVSLPEKTMESTKAGQQVRVTNYTLPNDTLQGSISQLSPAVESESRSYKGLITINNPKLKFRPGMFAKGEIVVASADNTIVIPKEIVLTKQRGSTVFVVEKGIAYERIVSFGLENPQEVQIVSGLSTKDRLVVKGFETLRDRSKVKEMK
ncbi:MAG TPA: efflux RND transporter periplasmic adaptor subunit [Bacteroidales bacterium]|nr:efflux RND transporter periplasmic adaptor subunit [Bacteroidales bacterium]